MSLASSVAVIGAVMIAGWWAGFAPAQRRVAAPVHLAVPPVAEPAAEAIAPDPGTLRVCADPNNLPFSSRDERGFENEIARLVARELGRSVRYYWMPQRRGFVRTTLAAGRCDVIIGVPAASDRVAVTRPYYRSNYVFVSRRDRPAAVRSLDDPRLRRLRIGIQITGTDYDNPPAAQALAARHITDNVRGYTVYGDYSALHPGWGVLEAVAAGDLDVAIVWGPLAGYFAKQAAVPLVLRAVTPQLDTPSRPFAFDIAMAVRRGDDRLAADLNAALGRRSADIRRILASYGIPLVPLPPRHHQEG